MQAILSLFGHLESVRATGGLPRWRPTARTFGEREPDYREFASDLADRSCLVAYCLPICPSMRLGSRGGVGRLVRVTEASCRRSCQRCSPTTRACPGVLLQALKNARTREIAKPGIYPLTSSPSPAKGGGVPRPSSSTAIAAAVKLRVRPRVRG